MVVCDVLTCVVEPLTIRLPETVRSFETVTSSGRPIVTVPLLSTTVVSFAVAANVTVLPRVTALLLVPSETVMLLAERAAMLRDPVV